MKKRIIESFIAIVIGIVLAVISFLFDKQIITYILNLRNIFLDYIFLSISFASNVFIIFFFLTTLFLWKEGRRRWIFPLWMSCFLSFAISFFIKIIMKRPRPFQEGFSVLEVLFHFMKNNFNVWNFSFPSFQAVLVFSALPILNKEFKKFRYIWFVFAFLVAFSRVYFGVQYLSDVLAGAVIGYLIGYLMILFEEKYGTGLKLTKIIHR